MLHNEQALSRRLIAIILALSLLCSLGVGVFADYEFGELTSDSSSYAYGETVTLRIPLDNSDRNEVVWYHNNQENLVHEAYDTSNTYAKKTFTMRSSLAGEWYCTVNGEKSNTITITQIGDDPVMTLSADKTVYSKGDTVTLTVTNIKTGVNFKEYQFYRDGKKPGGIGGSGIIIGESSITITLDPKHIMTIGSDDGIEGDWYCDVGGKKTNTITLTRAPGNVALQSSGAAKTLVRVSATPATFKVTVPSTLAFSIAADGIVTAPSNLEIANESNGPVYVSDVTVNADCEWSIDANGTDYQKVPVDSKQLTLSLNGDNTPATAAGSQGALTLTLASWPTINGNSDLAITAAADFAEQGAVLTNTSVCHVVYTVSWYTGT